MAATADRRRPRRCTGCSPTGSPRCTASSRSAPPPAGCSPTVTTWPSPTTGSPRWARRRRGPRGARRSLRAGGVAACGTPCWPTSGCPPSPPAEAPPGREQLGPGRVRRRRLSGGQLGQDRAPPRQQPAQRHDHVELLRAAGYSAAAPLWQVRRRPGGGRPPLNAAAAPRSDQIRRWRSRAARRPAAGRPAPPGQPEQHVHGHRDDHVAGADRLLQTPTRSAPRRCRAAGAGRARPRRSPRARR